MDSTLERGCETQLVSLAHDLASSSLDMGIQTYICGLRFLKSFNRFPLPASNAAET